MPDLRSPGAPAGPRVPFSRFSTLPWDGTADVTAAINSALVSLKSAYPFGAVLELPSGEATIGAKIVLPLGCGLWGQGCWTTWLTLADGADTDMVGNHLSADGIEANGMFTSVRHLGLNGNKANQASGSGIGWDLNPAWSSATNDPAWDPRHLVENVALVAMKEDGTWSNGRSEARYVNVLAKDCAGNGFSVGTDCFYEGCSAGGSGLAGFRVAGSYGFYISHCKSFYSGEVTAASGHGLHISDGAKVGVVTGFQSQDNKGYGLLAEGMLASRIDISCHSNGRDSSASRPDGARLVGCYGNVIDVVSVEGHSNTSSQRHAVSLWTGSAGNRIRLTHMDIDGGTILDPVNPASDALAENIIDVGGVVSAGGVTSANSGTAYDPADAWWGGGVQKITLTGNCTIDVPNGPVPGQRLTFLFTQDGTGTRTVAFNANYLVAGADFIATTGAGAKCSVSFVYDGANWIETGRAMALGTD